MKVGIKYQVDVKKLLKEYFYQGKKGTYVTLTSFVDLDNTDEYNNSGFIKQECGKRWPGGNDMGPQMETNAVQK